MKFHLIKSISIFIILTVSLAACEKLTPTGSQPQGDTDVSGDWLIPSNQIRDGGPGKDGIPAIQNPEFIEKNQATYLNDDDLVIGVKYSDSDMRAYPHIVLDWHEIVNDVVESQTYSVTFCPLTGSGIGWLGKFSGGSTTFGVSGLLYNSNLIPYDRATDSNWSQMKLQCVEGTLRGIEPDLFQVIETKWSTWKALYPDTKVLSTSTGYDRPYGRSPYGDYDTNHSKLFFSVSNEDGRLQRKTRVLGLLAGGTRMAFNISDFGNSTRIIDEAFGDTDYLIAGNSSANFAVAFLKKLQNGDALEDGKGGTLSFEPMENNWPLIMESSDDTKWDIFGNAVEGSLKGKRLQPAKSYIAFWFAWAAFYPETAIYQIN